MNLALLQQYGSNAWRVHNFLMEQNAKNLEKAVEDLKQLTVEVNRERKNFQVRVLLLRSARTEPRADAIVCPADWHRCPAHRARDTVDGAHLERAPNRDGERRAGGGARQAEPARGRAREPVGTKTCIPLPRCRSEEVELGAVLSPICIFIMF